ATLTDQYTGNGMGMTAEKLAEQYDISRDAQDEFAVESNQRAAKAVTGGQFDEEIIGVEVKTRKGTVVVDKDEHIKPDAS
ncbi:acetyl-CoA C-acyltransferase, partial [Streptococcus pneumoniae]|nr:acetyl-CoA C-acyltransferase [Streptococcus pneumoniae]